mmetsp:Transcript_80105/g.248603  ORF Transcript_80105/g.248603 Transcript_80105/m.248603 type:complete len:404 (+) Transcript_80105:126-1337(+)
MEVVAGEGDDRREALRSRELAPAATPSGRCLADAAAGPQHCLGRAIGVVFLVLLRSSDYVCKFAYLAVALSGVCFMGVMLVQLAPDQYFHGLRFHGFWEKTGTDKGELVRRIPEVAEGLLDGFQGVTILLLLAFLHRWPGVWTGRAGSEPDCQMADSHRKVPDPGRMHVRRLWVLLASLWVMHITLDYTCQRDVSYAVVIIACSLGFDLSANTFIWALWHEKLLFKHRLRALQRDWLRRSAQRDFGYDGYRDDYVQCSADLEPLSSEWSCMLGIFVVLHALVVLLRVVQMFCTISLSFNLVVYDYLLLVGQLFVYTSRLFIVLFWSVGMNNEADDLQAFVRIRLSPGGPPDILSLDLLSNLVKDCPISFCVLGLRPNKTEVVSLLVAVMGGIASAILGSALSN